MKKIKIFIEIAKKYGSQKKAALALGVSTSIYSEWVHGIKSPSPTKINVIAGIEGIKPGDLFEIIYPADN